jgi:HK97 family phage major capsid protein
MSDIVKNMIDERQKTWHKAKELLDNASAEGRSLTAEEEQSFARMNEDLDRRAKTIEDIKEAYAREERVAAAVADLGGSVVESRGSDKSDVDYLNALARGEIRAHTFEKRAISSATTSAPVKVSVYDRDH